MPLYLRAKYERQRRGLTQAEVAAKACLAQTLISAIETGRVNPSPDELAALGRAFGITPASVLLKPTEIHDPEELAEPING